MLFENGIGKVIEKNYFIWKDTQLLVTGSPGPYERHT